MQFLGDGDVYEAIPERQADGQLELSVMLDHPINYKKYRTKLVL